MSVSVPARRKRKLHVGLFGYSRNNDGIHLPRAITFTSTLYSIGIPPEILGIGTLSDDDIDFVRDIYVNFDADLKDALRYLNPDSRYLPEGITARVHNLVDFEIDEEHREISNEIISLLDKGNSEDLRANILRAAAIRKFIG